MSSGKILSNGKLQYHNLCLCLIVRPIVFTTSSALITVNKHVFRFVYMVAIEKAGTLNRKLYNLQDNIHSKYDLYYLE